jgi:gliding motility-associated-like protein
MNPNTLNRYNLPGSSGRRRNLLSALVIGFLFIVGLPVTVGAAPRHPHNVFDIVSITITRDYAIANKEQDVITVHISPTPTVSEKINFSWLGFGTDITVDGNGDAVIYISAASAGQVAVKMTRYPGTINATDLGTVNVTFIDKPGPVDIAKSYIEVIHSPETADGTSQDIVRAHLFDSYGHALTDTAVTFSIIGGTASFSSPAAGVTTGGILDATLVSTVIGDVQVGALVKVNGVNVYISNGASGNSVTVKFIAGSPDPAKSYIEVIHSPEAADGASEDIVRVHLFDKTGHPLPDTLVNFTIISGTATFSSPSSGPAGGGGTIDAKLVSNKIGSVQVGATVKINGVDVLISNGAGGTEVTVKFMAGPPDVTNQETKLVVDKGVAAADGSDANIVHAHLVDKDGNLINYPVDISFFIIPSGSADGAAVLAGSATGVTPDANGNLSMTIKDPTQGTVLIGATVTYKGVTTTITFGSPAKVIFVDPSIVDPSNPGNMLVVDKGTATADGADFTTIHAHLVNAAGGSLKNVTVTIEFFIIPSGPADATAVLSVIGAQSITTNSTGDIYLNIKDIKAGTVQLGARITYLTVTRPITTGSPAPVEFVADVAVPSAPGVTDGTMLTIVKDFAPGDGVDSNAVHAHITDKNGNPVKNQVVTFSIRAGGTSTATAKLVGTVTVTTDASGNAVMYITNSVPGTTWIDATIDYNGNPVSLIDGAYKEITFTNLPDVTNPATRLIVIVYEALADGVSTTVVKAHVVDLNGDPLPGRDVTFSIDSGTAQIVTPGPWTTDANGDISIEISSAKPGFALITATVGGKAITFGSPARVKFAAINIYVPRVFTPNGDGTNDVLKPILVGISAFHYFNVYNRWGNLIFTTQDPNYGWDGRFKGVPQPVETYLWIAEGIDINGKKIVAKGMTSLVK